MMASNLTQSFEGNPAQGFDTRGKYISTLTYPVALAPDIPYTASTATPPLTPEATGDYDSALPRALDGPYINKPDEGNIWNNSATAIPYFASANYGETPGNTFFSPNRMMPSPGMFGSLPTGVISGSAWQTLLFRPQPGHPGAKSPEDHLLMDLFWMPVVQPYAISDQFSTAGKINMNYQIAPFSYITRNTALRALLKSEKVTAIRNADIGTASNLSGYRAYGPGTVPPAAPPTSDSSYAQDFRLAIDQDQTLSQFDTKFATNNLFRSESEICDLHIVPVGQTVSSMPAFWNNSPSSGHALTGDNLRERIYTTLYPRLTTKSNTYTVHFRAQSLKQSTQSTSQGQWVEGQDAITGDYRGSATIERYIDPNDQAIPDYAAQGASPTSLPLLGNYYRWRVIANHQFAP